MPATSSQPFLLGDWKVEPLSGSLTGADGVAEHLEPKVMEVFARLAMTANEVVTRQELLDTVWDGTTGSDEQLTRAIGILRRALGDSPGEHAVIETIPKRGYRLIGDVRFIENGSAMHRGGPTRRFAVFAAIALLVVAVGYLLIERSTTVQTDTGTVSNSIAVLPFANMSDDPANEYFADGLSEEILNLLANVPNLKVAGRTSSFAFKGTNDDLRSIGQTLGVNYLLEGSVRQSGDQVRITAQLIDVADGTHVWSESYDRDLTDIFAVQESVAAAVIEALQFHVADAPSRGRPTNSLEAYSIFLKARIAANRLEWASARELLMSAVSMDPDFGEAYELLAVCYWHMVPVTLDGKVGQQLSFEAAGKALKNNPNLVFAEAIYRSGDVGNSSPLSNVEAFTWAYREQPDNPYVLDALATLLIHVGYLEQALAVAQHYARVDPISLEANLHLFGAYYAAGYPEEAFRTLELISRIGVIPHNWQWTIAGIQIAEGKTDAAIESFAALPQLYGQPRSQWVSEVVAGASDSENGRAYLDNQIPKIAESLSDNDGFDWRLGLINWYLYFGFIDRYFELVLAPDPRAGEWHDADDQMWHGHALRRLGFTAHPDYLRLVTNLGITDVWEKLGPPDFCQKQGGSWMCE